MSKSVNGNPFELENNSCYYIIDALYLDQIKSNLSDIDENNIEDEIRKKIFPYTSSPFAVLKFSKFDQNSLIIDISNFKKSNLEDANWNTFSTDTGLVVMIECSIFMDFAKAFDYDLLTAGNLQLINSEYWISLENQFGQRNCAIILAPGIKSGFEFDGSGKYSYNMSNQ